MEKKQILERIIATFKAGFEKMKADREEWTAEEKAYREKLMAIFEANQGETKVYPEQMEANPEEIGSEAEHDKFPKEQAAVKPVGGLRKRHRGRNLAAERRQKPKERTWGICGSLKLLTAVGMRTTRHAKVAWRKGTSSRKTGPGTTWYEEP
jgi:hypothetical protein